MTNEQARCRFCGVLASHGHFDWCKVTRAPSPAEVMQAVIDEEDRCVGGEGPSSGLADMAKAALAALPAEPKCATCGATFVRIGDGYAPICVCPSKAAVQVEPPAESRCDCGSPSMMLRDHAPWCLIQPAHIREPELERRAAVNRPPEPK